MCFFSTTGHITKKDLGYHNSSVPTNDVITCHFSILCNGFPE